MKFAVWPSMNDPWAETLAIARHAEATGWDGVYYADHFMPNDTDLSAPVGECWTTLAALAAAVPRIRIGPLVTGNTYRHPAVLAKMAATVDIISGGRLVLGLGAGWQENEHRAYGIEFSTVGGRLSRLEEACHIITSLFANRRTTFAGRYYQLTDAPLEPKPVQSPVPLLIGGGGEQRTLRIAARYANEWNVWGTPEVLARKGQILDRYCEELGRDPRTIRRSAQALLVMTDDRSLIERVRASGRPVLGGTGPELRALVEQYAEAGVNELIIPGFSIGRTLEEKLATLDRFNEQVITRVSRE
ncbi:TIGR03560 family F420-dependent LLM class oxidoreductase [Tepidiforma thermophila]|uniref:F420-dependent oxidoreductase-like protein n=1 Tax=Tepidiforma thermophila (strain KCTC 52669 / CGMCC 1.13589 / G233) TaxID=2761530 RepID=A0A2A9HA78_TEPT2|nr:TIGR03560 family F420-dependent LLM class oxidoreductase [Tepidiforma thermophila]PFG72834.1 F420-dependent oxidoreductase-like protein [Tepidiforma thermophila]